MIRNNEGGETMSGLMKLLGTLLLIAALAFLLMLKLSSAQMQVWGINPDVVATLLVGGILSVGLGGLIEAVKSSGGALALAKPIANEIIAEPAPDVLPVNQGFGFGRKRVEPPAEKEPASTIATVTKVAAVTSVADTIAALEQAKSDIKTALGGVESMTAPEEELKPTHVEAAEIEDEPEAATEAVVADANELYVVEEKIIRGRPSRILSDETVEAETDEGWMRFENLEHLNEYLDSVEEADA
jgi:hypothetical protein